MRIAQVSPLYESVPPKFYGGTERVVHYLTETLVKEGHEVTLFASADSHSSAELDPCCEQSLRLDRNVQDSLPHHLRMIEKVAQRANEFDIIHFHVDYLSFPLARRINVPQLATMHGRLDLPDLPTIFTEFNDAAVVSISHAQRAPLPHANWVGNVYHGLPAGLHEASTSPGSYFAFLGRISPEKGIERAIQIAKLVNVPLKIAAKISDADRQYFHEVVEPLLQHPLIEFVGEIGEAQKGDFLRGARALLFPIDWPEPFGLVMIEAMACGTPVLAFKHGSVPEVMRDGVSGRVVQSMPEAVAAARTIHEMDRREVRKQFESRFSAERMTDGYLDIYSELIASQKSRPRRRSRPRNRAA